MNVRIILRHTPQKLILTLHEEPNSSDEKYNSEQKISLKIELKGKQLPQKHKKSSSILMTIS